MQHRTVLQSVAVHRHSETLEDFLNPAGFKMIEGGCKAIYGYDELTNTYTTPSLALRIGYSLKKCMALAMEWALEIDNDDKMKHLQTFMYLCSSRWNFTIASGAYRSLAEKRRNVVKLLPLGNDVKKLSEHLRRERQSAYDTLSQDPSNTEAWDKLRDTTLASLITFNRWRQGEVSNMLLDDYGKIISGDPAGLVSKYLFPLEQKLSAYFLRVEIIGKRGQMMALLVTRDLKANMDLLQSSRPVLPNNVYFFAQSSHRAQQHVRGCDVLRTTSVACGAEIPKLLRLIAMRKQIATMTIPQFQGGLLFGITKIMGE